MGLHCWTGRLEVVEAEFGWGSDQFWDEFARDVSETCMLPHGHDGPHEWTPDDEIMVSLPHPEPGSE